MAAKSKAKKPAARKPTKKAVARTTRKRPAAKPVERRAQPENLRLRAAAPGFTVDDLEKSIAWYRDVLGLILTERWEQDGKLAGVELRAGNLTFMLSQDDWKKGRNRAKGEGFRLYCTTAQDIDRLADAIKARGGTLLQEPRDQPWGMRDFAVADPDGFKITIGRDV
jgi:lactoylglutathione lyase